MCVRIWGHHALQIGARRRHRERIAVERTHHIDITRVDHRPHLVAAADRPRRNAGAERLSEADKVGLDAEELSRATRCNGEASLHLINDPDDAELLGDASHIGEIAGLWQDHAAVHHRGLHDQTGGETSFTLQCGKSSLKHTSIIEWHRRRHLRDGVWDSLAVGDGWVVLAIAPLVHRESDIDHHVVVVSVVAAEDLHHTVAAGCATSESDRIHGGFRAGVDEAPAGESPARREMLSHDVGVFGWRGEV